MFARLEEHDVVADYLQLLRRGSVTRSLAVAEHPRWEGAIRARTHADGLSVRTWSRAGPPANVWAVLRDFAPTRKERERLRTRLAWLRED
jgi:hypothetical protein